jgi:serine/threonine protein kinase
VSGLKLGWVIDSQYLLKCVLGVGSFGAVNEAQDLVLEKLVALKILHSTFTKNEHVATRLNTSLGVALWGSAGYPRLISQGDLGSHEDMHGSSGEMAPCFWKTLAATMAPSSMERLCRTCRHIQ